MRIINPSILGIDNKDKIVSQLIDHKLDWIHYDIMDNQFVPNESLLNDELIEIINNTPKHIVEVHLMVKEPLKYFDNLPIIPDYASMHYDQIKDLSREEIKSFIKKNKSTIFGIAINPQYTLKDIKHIIDLFSFVTVMTVQAGFGGQSFMKDRLDVVKEISTFINDNQLPMYIQVDGGAKLNNINIIEASGARNIVVGSFLMKNLNKETINKLKGI